MKKEEQKQHLINMMRDDENLGLYKNWVEDAEKESNLSDLNSKANIFWSGFRVGVKSKERMYSEEEVLEIIRQYALEEHLITSSKPDIWFKQYKKK
jgi:hypothetical protein